jgi:hypothetical protein
MLTCVPMSWNSHALVTVFSIEKSAIQTITPPFSFGNSSAQQVVWKSDRVTHGASDCVGRDLGLGWRRQRRETGGGARAV